MRTPLSLARRSLTVACVGLATVLPVVIANAPNAGAASPPASVCGFHFGAISEDGAAGTLAYTVVVNPANPAQSCSTALTFTAKAAPTAIATTGPYTTIDHNPLTATQMVTFTPGQPAPAVRIEWALFHCADPAVPGAITFTSGAQSAAVAIDPTTCAGMSHSVFNSLPLPPTAGAVGIAPTADDKGYRTVSPTGVLTPEGDATAFTTFGTNAAVVGLASPHTGNGVWVAAADGGVFTYGSAPFEGSLGAMHINQPIVGIAPTPSGHGYWLAAADGGVFSFGDAAFHGSLGATHLNEPIVGIAATPDGKGYFLTASDGGVFAFGTAAFAGSLGSTVLNAPIVGMAAGPHGGYWLVASDGAIFSFGGVPFEGSLGATHLNAPIAGMAATSTGKGYWLVGADNGIFTFGDAHFFGSNPITSP